MNVGSWQIPSEGNNSKGAGPSFHTRTKDSARVAAPISAERNPQRIATEESQP